jgi:hypothetical protein
MDNELDCLIAGGLFLATLSGLDDERAEKATAALYRIADDHKLPSEARRVWRMVAESAGKPKPHLELIPGGAA